MSKHLRILIILSLFRLVNIPQAQAHQVTFCGEIIPLSEEFVVNKLMNVIRRQMPVANLPSLRYKASRWFPTIEKFLKKHGIPEDFKYLPIVESGFANVESRAGAYGFWQLMPETAKEYNLIVNKFLDERDDPVKSTSVACQLLRNYYNSIKKQSGSGSWVLTAAAYNFGIGNIMKAVQRQGGNYFRMDLNAETAEYVYKLIAVKELFENPEIYMNGFGRNVFNEETPNSKEVKAAASSHKIDDDFKAISIPMGSETAATAPKKKPEIWFIPCRIARKDKGFKDGNLVAIRLEDDLNIPGKFSRKGNVIQGIGWIVDGRVFVNLGYGHRVQLLDGNMKKGVPVEQIASDKEDLFLKVEVG